AWKLLDNLSGKNRRKNPQPLRIDGTTITNKKAKADAFNKHFAAVNKSARRRCIDRPLRKLLKIQEKATTAHDQIFEETFTPGEMETALTKLKNRKAPGQDRIWNEMIKHLGISAKSSLLKFINRTWIEGKLPRAWRTATIRPVPKPGKSTDELKNFRPISLTSSIGKLAERMVNQRLYWWLEKNGLLDSTQAGFRKGCRTEDQLFRLTQKTIDGFQEKRSTVAVFIDLQQAYDRVWRQGLFMKMWRLGVHGKMYHWIKAFLRDRTIQTTIDGQVSSLHTLEEGLPQGSALSCTLFLIFLNDLPGYLDVNKALFADDLVIWSTSKYPILSQGRLNEALLTISAFANFWKLKVNYSKTVYSVFTRSPQTAKRNFKLHI
ncbi:MAG: reverse transcriptase family protein, partial [Candidatus Omnitrophica bacterium]|nr:reverse transcriptase family protein [Candidatus Omnitrophota bacterium]